MRLRGESVAGFVSADAMRRARGIWEALLARPAEYDGYLGWLDCAGAARGTTDAILEKADEIRSIADALIVVGVGGSNHASRAVLEALGARDIDIVWLGNTLSAFEFARETRRLEGKRVCVNVIAKNFETLEPGAHYRALRAWMRGQYGESEMRRRFVLTGTTGSRLHEIARENGHLFLPFPEDIGGRFSAFSPVALLPLAAAGLDIVSYVAGGREMERAFKDGRDDGALSYAVWRNECLSRGFDIEMLCAFEPRLAHFARWWRQLFAESEGKDGKGIFPASAIFSEDLHSVGQYLQEGPRRVMETFLRVEDPGASAVIPADAAFRDGFDYLAGMDFTSINRIAEQATLDAHRAGGAPCAEMEIERLDERALGGMFYFFMAACAVSARLLGVCPFDQNGVEEYKRSMFSALGKG